MHRKQEPLHVAMHKALVGETSTQKLVHNMSQVFDVMREWPRSEQLDTIGAMYGLLFDELKDFLFADTANETQEFCQGLEEAFMGFLASRITMDVSARLFKDKMMIFKAHLVAKHLDPTQTADGPKHNMFVDETLPQNGNTHE